MQGVNKIPENIDKDEGRKCNYRILNDEEYLLKPQKIINVIKSGEYAEHLINED